MVKIVIIVNLELPKEPANNAKKQKTIDFILMNFNSQLISSLHQTGFYTKNSAINLIKSSGHLVWAVILVITDYVPIVMSMSNILTQFGRSNNAHVNAWYGFRKYLSWSAYVSMTTDHIISQVSTWKFWGVYVRDLMIWWEIKHIYL